MRWDDGVVAVRRGAYDDRASGGEIRRERLSAHRRSASVQSLFENRLKEVHPAKPDSRRAVAGLNRDPCAASALHKIRRIGWKSVDVYRIQHFRLRRPCHASAPFVLGQLLAGVTYLSEDIRQIRQSARLLGAEVQ